MQVVAAPEARVREVLQNDRKSIVRNYFGSAATMHEGVQGFLAELPDAGSRIDPHFHDVDQFQVVVAGDGKIGKDELFAGAFHYADAFTPYGPIVARQEGISFFTLRRAAAGGFYKMPGSKQFMQTRPGRNVAGSFMLGKSPVTGSEAVRERLIERQPDGLEVVGLRVAPNGRVDGLPCEDGGGQYYLVFTGSLVHDGKELPARSMIYVEPGEATPTLQAGADGAEILVMQFPHASERLGSDPAKLAGRAPDSYQAVGGRIQFVD